MGLGPTVGWEAGGLRPLLHWVDCHAGWVGPAGSQEEEGAAVGMVCNTTWREGSITDWGDASLG